MSIDRAKGVASTACGVYRDGLSNAANPCTRPGTGTCSPFNLVALLGAPLGSGGRTPANDGRINSRIGINDSPANGNPGSVLVRGFALPAIAPGGVISSGPAAYAYRFAPDGRLVAYDRGTIFGAPIPGPLAASATASRGDGLRLFDHVALTSRIQRINAALSFTFEVSDRLTLFADALYYHGKADEPVDLPSFNGVLFGGVSGALTFRSDNPFLTAQAREQLAAIGAGETFQLSRANVDRRTPPGPPKAASTAWSPGRRGSSPSAGAKSRSKSRRTTAATTSPTSAGRSTSSASSTRSTSAGRTAGSCAA